MTDILMAIIGFPLVFLFLYGVATMVDWVWSHIPGWFWVTLVVTLWLLFFALIRLGAGPHMWFLIPLILTPFVGLAVSLGIKK